MTYLHFVTLNTGEISRFPPPDGRVIDAAALDLRRALADNRAKIAAHPDYAITALAVGSALLCTIYQGDMPLSTFGVAPRSRHAAKLWALMQGDADQYGYTIGKDDMPPVPWCAVRVEPGLVLSPGAPWQWLAAYESDIAMAWIKKRHNTA